MALVSINHDLAQIALDKVNGSDFEMFAQSFLSVIEGRNFVPIGGTHDCGADGVCSCDNERTFYQFTRQENHREKLRHTVRRLGESGRNVKVIYYVTSRLVPRLDHEEDLLSDELGVTVKIRDRKYIISHINDSTGTISAYENCLAHYTQFLSNLNRDNKSFKSVHVANPAAYVFLQHEVTNRRGNRKLIHSITDSLILWSLSETDPDKNIFMTEIELTNKIINAFPWTNKVIKSNIHDRLMKMKKKDKNGREVGWHSKEKKYYLPFTTRQIVAAENTTDELLEIRFLEEIQLYCSEIFDADEGVYRAVSDLCLNVIHLTFEKQGLLFAHLLSDTKDNQPLPVVADCIDEILKIEAISSSERERYREYLVRITRKIFYDGSPTQRGYMKNLSRTYVLLFTLQAEPRIIEYFSTMSASFNLYIGSDILIQALSERFIPLENQTAHNLLRMATRAGVTMYLSQSVLDEIYTHIRATYYEFINNFSEMEQYITPDIWKESDRILIRSYFYAKGEKKVNSWGKFLDQFISYKNIDSIHGQEELRKYLVADFNFIFVDNSELESVSDLRKVNALAQAMLDQDDKDNKELAYNTALLVHGIYGLRQKQKETSGVSEFGYKTWWMTNQRRVLRHTQDIVKNKHAKYIMRPDFLLNFLAIAPTCEKARETFSNVFPTSFGIQLGHRLKEEVFHSILQKVKDWKDYEPGRIITLMSTLSDELKSDDQRKYDLTINDEII